jgi:hypothetical protein
MRRSPKTVFTSTSPHVPSSSPQPSSPSQEASPSQTPEKNGTRVGLETEYYKSALRDRLAAQSAGSLGTSVYAVAKKGVHNTTGQQY